MRQRRVILWIAATIAVLVLLAFGYHHFILDWEGRPVCDKGIMFAFYEWMNDNGRDPNTRTNAFPNINGIGADSFATISNAMGSQMAGTREYRYVPGLRQNDPEDLVLVYLDRPTRWTWHEAYPTIFKKKAWMFVPVDFTMGDRQVRGGGELSERVSLGEFRSRLKRTLDFIRTNERPNWQAVVAEHSKFLNSLQDDRGK